MIRGLGGGLRQQEEAASVPRSSLCISIQHRHQSGSKRQPSRLLQAGGDVKIQEPGGGGGTDREGCFLHYKMHHLSRSLVQSAGSHDPDTRHCQLQGQRRALCLTP